MTATTAAAINTVAEAEAWLASEGYTVRRQRCGEDLYYIVERDTPACNAGCRTDDALIDFVRRHMPAQPAPRLVCFVWANTAGTLREVYDADSDDRFGRAFRNDRNALRYIEQFIADRCADQPATVKTLTWHRNPLSGVHGDCVLTFYYEGARLPVVNGWAISLVGTDETPVGWRIYEADGTYHGMDADQHDAIAYCFEYGAGYTYADALGAASSLMSGEPAPAETPAVLTAINVAFDTNPDQWVKYAASCWGDPHGNFSEAVKQAVANADHNAIIEIRHDRDPIGRVHLPCTIRFIFAPAPDAQPVAGWREEVAAAVADESAAERERRACEWCGHCPCACEEDGPDRLCEYEPTDPRPAPPSAPQVAPLAQIAAAAPAPVDSEPLYFCALVGEAEDDVSEIRFMTADELAIANEDAERASADAWRWVGTLDERQILHLTRMHLWHKRVMALAERAPAFKLVGQQRKPGDPIDGQAFSI